MIRGDFVSNSSSTSFAIIGKDYSIDDLITIFTERENKEISEYPDATDFVWDCLDKIEDLNVCRGLDEYGEDTIIIGLSYTEMKRDETREQFENRIVDKLKDHGLPVSNDKVEFYIDQCYNG